MAGRRAAVLLQVVGQYDARNHVLPEGYEANQTMVGVPSAVAETGIVLTVGTTHDFVGTAGYVGGSPERRSRHRHASLS